MHAKRVLRFGTNVDMNVPLVTVLMGVFNSRAYLDASIRSILEQTFSDFEFLIIDDASTDGSDEVVQAYAQRDKRIRFLRNETNAGLGIVLRRGVEEARGDLIARMDADDVALPSKLQKQVQYFQDHPNTDVVGTFALDVAADGTPIRERSVPVTHEKIVELVWTNPFLHPTVMFRKESILRVGSYSPVRRRQDYELWFRCVSGGLRLANIPEPLLHYHFSEATMKRNHLRSMWEQVKIGLRGCRLVKASAVAYIGTCVPLIEALLPNAVRLRLSALKSFVDPRRNLESAQKQR